MAAVAARAREQQVSLQAIQKLSNGELPPDPAVEVTRDNDDPRLTTYPLVAGTAWLFARPEHDQQFDYLMVDEAGQVALANIVAVGTAAQNVVLVGDPMQLSQPIQGTHPGQSGNSGLGYVLDGFATVPPERGIFLPVSRRLHPLICTYVSDVVYDPGLGGDGIVVAIEDLGRGMPWMINMAALVQRQTAPTAGWRLGLARMRERIHRMGGTLEITSANSRTIVRASIPVPHEDAHVG